MPDTTHFEDAVRVRELRTEMLEMETRLRQYVNQRIDVLREINELKDRLSALEAKAAAKRS